MKVSISLPEEDVEFLDRYASRQGYKSRSAVMHRAVRLLRSSELGEAYEAAWAEWDAAGDATLWDGAAADGVASS